MDISAQSMLNDTGEKRFSRSPPKISKFRRYLPQVSAAMAKNLIALNLGLFDSLSSIVIPSVTGLSKELNPDETLQIIPSQASWIPSFTSFTHPIGAITGWILSDSIGRRKSLLIATIPIIISWSMLSCSSSLLMINIAFTIMGLGLGLKEAPSLTYTGEVCETPIRGILLASAGIFGSLGVFLLYLLGAFLSWRQVAVISISIPICIFMAVFFIPETPIWLLSKDRQGKALESLKWLRGCVSSDTVIDEYENLQKYSTTSMACSKCAKKSIKCDHSESLLDKVKHLKRKRIIKPIIVITTLQFFNQFGATTTWRPYIIQILNAYAIRWNANYTAVVLSSLAFVARICILPAIKIIGKRKIYLASTVTTIFCCFALSLIGFQYFPSHWTSFQIASNHNQTNSTTFQASIGSNSYLALALILIMQFANNIGIAMLPFMLISEIFPFKDRAMLCSLSSSVRYIFAAMSTKLYYNLEMWFSMSGATAFYGFVSLVGFAVTYAILPETEGRSLEDIELHFSDNTKSITDIKIQRKLARANIP